MSGHDVLPRPRIGDEALKEAEACAASSSWMARGAPPQGAVNDRLPKAMRARVPFESSTTASYT